MSHVIWHCNGVGKVDGYEDVKMPRYRNGISTYAWAPPPDMPRKRQLAVDARLEKLRQKQLAIIAKETGGKITGDPTMHERESA